MAYEVQLERFTGPLDLLLHLIEKNELDLAEIPLAKIIEEYLAYLKTLEKLDIANISEFIEIAVHLLEIKAALLFPKSNDPAKKEEEMSEEKMKEQLVSRLWEYRKYKEAAKVLCEWEALDKKIYPRPVTEKEEMTEFVVLDDLAIESLARRLKKVLERKNVQKDLTRVIVLEQYTVPERMEQIGVLLENSIEPVEFESFFAEDKNKLAVITTFLAILELIKMGSLEFWQDDNFQPIWLKKAG